MRFSHYTVKCKMQQKCKLFLFAVNFVQNLECQLRLADLAFTDARDGYKASGNGWVRHLTTEPKITVADEASHTDLLL